jgi:phospholipase/carboxylesterase
MELDRSLLQLVPHYFKLRIPDRKHQIPVPVLVALHGYAGDMQSMMLVANDLAEEDMIIASVQGPHQFFYPTVETGESQKVAFGWQTPYRSEDSLARHHHLIQRVVREACSLHHGDPARVFLIGFSQACAMNYRLVFTRPGLIRGVVGVCGGLPKNIADPKFKPGHASILHIAATRDQFYPIEKSRAYPEVLGRFSPDVSFHEYEAPHAFPRRSIPFIRRWILERMG